MTCLENVFFVQMISLVFLSDDMHENFRRRRSCLRRAYVCLLLCSSSSLQYSLGYSGNHFLLMLDSPMVVEVSLSICRYYWKEMLKPMMSTTFHWLCLHLDWNWHLSLNNKSFSFSVQIDSSSSSLPISIANSGFSETVSNFLRKTWIVLNAYSSETKEKRQKQTHTHKTDFLLLPAVEHQVPDQWSHDTRQEEFSSQYLWV